MTGQRFAQHLTIGGVCWWSAQNHAIEMAACNVEVRAQLAKGLTNETLQAIASDGAAGAFATDGQA